MAWYWIVLIVIGYISVGIFIANCVDFCSSIENDVVIATLVFFWPLAVVIFFVIAILKGFKDLIDWASLGIVSGVENLIDDIKYKIKQGKVLRISRSKSQNEEESSKV